MAQPNKDELALRIRDVEQENSNLASLYVALSQLHSTLDVRDVVSVVVEILINFVGADRFAILAPDAGGVLRAVAAHGIDRSVVPTCRPGDDVHVGEFGPARDPRTEPPIVCIPLTAAGERIGVLSVWGFLKQKTGFADIDFEIFQLLARSAGTALEAARLAMTSRRQPPAGYYEAFTALIE